MTETGLYPNYDRDPTEEEIKQFKQERYEDMVAMASPPDDERVRNLFKSAVAWCAENYPNEVIHTVNTTDYETEKMRKFVEDQ